MRIQRLLNRQQEHIAEQMREQIFESKNSLQSFESMERVIQKCESTEFGSQEDKELSEAINM